MIIIKVLKVHSILLKTKVALTALRIYRYIVIIDLVLGRRKLDFLLFLFFSKDSRFKIQEGLLTNAKVYIHVTIWITDITQTAMYSQYYIHDLQRNK